MPFDLAGARSAGYSDDEIAGFLASESHFDVEGARRAGYTSTEVIGYLADRAGPAQPAEPEQPGGDPMGSGAPEIMAVAKPKPRSVLEGQVLDERPFDPAQAERLSNRDYAQRTPNAYDPRQTAPQIGPARPMTEMVSGERTPGEFAGDTAAAVLKIGPTALKTLAQLYSMGTGGAVGPGAEKQLDIGTAAIDKAFGSQASAQERRELSAILRNPDEGTDTLLAFLAGHPMLMADMGITTVGSMFVPAGAVGIAGKVARVPLQARTAQAVSQAVNDAMNAAQTFSETQGDTGDKYLAAAIAAIGSRGAGKLTGGGMEGQIARSMAGQKLEAAGVLQGAKTVGKEIGKESAQEYGENFTQQVGQDIGEGHVPDLGAAHKQGVLGAAVAPIATGPMSVANLAKPSQPGMGAPAVPDPIQTIRQAPTVDAAIEAASVAVTAPPGPGATAVDNIARILGQEIADAGQATAVSPVPAEATGSGSPDAAPGVAVGMGAPAAGVGAVEPASSQPGPAAGTVPLEAGQPAAVAPAAPVAPVAPPVSGMAGPQLTVNPTGTVTITGDAGAIERLLRAHGVTKMLPATNGVIVGKSDAEAAQRAMAPFAKPEPAAAPAALTATPGRRTYTISDAVGADGPVNETVSLVVKPNGDSVILTSDDRTIDVSNMIKAGFSAERAIAQAIGHDTTGKNVTEASAASPAPVESLGATGKAPAGGRNARARAAEANPFRAFLARHGITSELASDFAPGLKERRAAMVAGYGPIFRKSGKQLDALAQAAMEEGFLPTADPDRLYQLIDRVMRGERIVAQYTPDAVEREMQDRIQRQRELDEEEAVAALASLDDNQLLEVEAAIPDADAPSDMTTAAAMRAMGFSEQEISDATAKGSEGPPAGGEGRAGAGQAAAPEAPRADRGGEAAPPTAAEPAALSYPGKQRAPSSEGVPASGPDLLTAPTERDVLDQQQRRQAGDRAEAQRRRDEEQRAAADAQREDFTLTGSDRSADANPAQQDLVAEPAPVSTKPERPADQQRLIELRKRKSVLESLLKCLG